MSNSFKIKKQKLLIAMSSTFAVHGFFIPHIKKLSGKYEITLIANPSQHPLKEFLHDYVTFVAIDVERKISLLRDIKFFIQMFLLVLQLGPCHILTMTPKVGLIMGLVGFFCRVKNRTHILAGQVWQTKSGFSRKFLKSMDWLLIRCLTNRLADSQSQIEFLVEEGVAKPGMIKTLCEGSICGVDTELYQPNFSKYQSVRSRNGCGSNDFVILYLGRMVEDKGIFDALTSILRASRIHKRIVFWTAGPDEEGLAKQLEDRALMHDLRFKYFGTVPSTLDFFQAADLFIMPSKREGFGSVLIEAAACGLPSLCYRTHGVVDAVEDGVTGVLAEYCDVDDLSEKLIKILKNPSKLGQMAGECRRRTIE